MAFYISRFKNIEKHELGVEVVTPLFLGGADPQKAELRAAPIKGALRYWWRALYAHLSLKELKLKEATDFGDAGDRVGKSKVGIKLFDNLGSAHKERYNPVPHKQVRFNFEGFKPGSHFSVELYSNEKIVELFKIFSVLGGVGKRSRRGFGSIAVKKIDNEQFQFDYSLSEISALLNNFGNIFAYENNHILRNVPAHSDANYPYIKEIQIGYNLHNDSQSILKAIGQSSHENKSDFTGYARGKERFSSPVYVSVIKTGNRYRSIVTTLNTAFKQNQTHGVDKSLEFKTQILSGGAK